MNSSGTSRRWASEPASSPTASRRNLKAAASRLPALASSTAMRSSKSFMSCPWMTICPQASQRVAGRQAVKVWPQTSRLSSKEMETTLSRPHRPQVFIGASPLARPVGNPGEQKRLVQARGRRRERGRRMSAAQLRERAVFAVDPWVCTALLAKKPRVQQVFRHHVAHGRDDGSPDTRVLGLQAAEERLDPLAL